jgi:hypothetical protein
LGLTGDRLRTILGGWVLDYPTELAAGSIYTHRERWSRIWTGHTAAGGEEECECGEYVFSVVAVTPVVDGKLEGVTAMRWRGLDTRRNVGRR